MSAVSASTPLRSAPATKRPRYASSASWERLRLIARRSPSASPTLNPASAIATSSTWSWKTTTPSVERRHSVSRGWSTGGTNDGSSRSFCRCSTYGCTALPWIGPGRTSATCTVRSSRFSGRVRSSDCICAGLCDLLDAVLDRGEHAEPEQVDLQEACIGAGVLVPLAHLPSRHRRRLHGNELDQRSRRDHHPAGMLRDVTR